ncbi:mitochondrial inner membrane protein OXA1L [Neocloeon triangulifer]|uniref:mitochondrial inner membrane protein OXA1L n=1 Tax=Neocloeon triangulifer TaxID=2078957 RepID=UPI00286FABBA|nr:mitochondrial inner membrane protein OXA1L [Neocloeon triangulifer]
MAALVIPRAANFAKFRHVTPVVSIFHQYEVRGNTTCTSIRHHSLSACTSRSFIRTGCARSPYLLAGWRAASTTTDPNTFVKLSGPTTPPQTSVEKENFVAEVTAESATDSIPALPDLPVLEPEALNALGEATLASIGLGGWTPVGFLQNCLEYLHVDCSLPWWGAIMTGTLIARLLMFPLVVKAQQNAAKMNNNLPQMQVLQMKMSEARQSGNQLDAARYGQELMVFMREKQISPFKNMLVPLAQAPIFISFFVGLRKMANAPVESFHTGGMLWFTDLTVCDPYYILPVITSVTLWATIELGTDTAKLSSQNMHLMKYVLRAMPVIIFPFTMNFPAAILCYWMSSNLISLVQVGILKIPAVRDYCKIERLITHDPNSLPRKEKGFVKGFKESWDNMKVTKEMEERARFNESQFQKYGEGPIPKTYKYDPTRQRNAVAAKKRDK